MNATSKSVRGQKENALASISNSLDISEILPYGGDGDQSINLESVLQSQGDFNHLLFESALKGKDLVDFSSLTSKPDHQTGSNKLDFSLICQ